VILFVDLLHRFGGCHRKVSSSKVIIPAAGLGTGLFPATREQPKGNDSYLFLCPEGFRRF
jgi:hypothetical protein